MVDVTPIHGGRTNNMLLATMATEEIRELEEYVTTISASVEEEMDRLLPQVNETDESRLFDAMRYSVFAGGKRLRPVLVMATNDLLRGKRPRALRVATAMEMLHTYSLIHDDLPCMDDDDLRRGKPTSHIKFDEATAVLAGDALLTQCFEVLSDRATHSDSTVRCELISLFAQSAGAAGMVGGQMMDIIAESRPTETLDQGALARLQRKKTGALFSACCESAIILNGASREEHHRLTSYARNIGLAFQMVDDVLDEIGSEEDMGKAVGKDAGLGKATFVSLLGVEGARKQAEFLCLQAIQFIQPFGRDARMLELLARFVVARGH
ncbi:MAG: farnesyl diphosphate synthase [Alphaproteobacteria bacterium]|jgi:farnesyl diphosphate synthase